MREGEISPNLLPDPGLGSGQAEGKTADQIGSNPAGLGLRKNRSYRFPAKNARMPECDLLRKKLIELQTLPGWAGVGVKIRKCRAARRMMQILKRVAERRQPELCPDGFRRDKPG